MSLLELRNVTAGYGGSQALFGVDLDVGAGEVVALMGRNGMGKTTTVKSICRMLPTQGTIRFDGQDLCDRGYNRHEPDDRHGFGALDHKGPFPQGRVALRVMRKDAHCIPADAKEHRVAQTNEAAQAQRNV